MGHVAGRQTRAVMWMVQPQIWPNPGSWMSVLYLALRNGSCVKPEAGQALWQDMRVSHCSSSSIEGIRKLEHLRSGVHVVHAGCGEVLPNDPRVLLCMR